MSKKMSRYPSERKVYVGDLGSKARKDDIEYAFAEYGPICSVWVARNPPGFAFVEYEDARDAADAVRELSGRSLFGRRIRVELSTGKTVHRRNDRKRSSRYDDNSDEKCFDCGVRGHYARECRRYVRARRRNDNEASGRRTPSVPRGRRTPSPRATRSRSRSGSRHRNSPTSTTVTRRERHERRKHDTKRSRERDSKRSREREVRYSDDEKRQEHRRNGRRPPSPDAPRRRDYDSRSPSANSSDSRSGSDSDDSSRRGGDDSSVSYSRSSSRKD